MFRTFVCIYKNQGLRLKNIVLREKYENTKKIIQFYDSVYEKKFYV